MLTIEQASRLPGFWDCLRDLEGQIPRLLSETVDLAEIPSPTFDESRRAVAVRELLAQAFGDATLDPAGNVRACLPGDPRLPTVLLSAPLDAAYGSDIYPLVDVRRVRLTGWGVATHAIALGALAAMARALWRHFPGTLGTLWLAATAGSEMSGDLRGMHSMFPWLKENVNRVICLQGPGVGRLDHWSVGTYRGELTVWAPGGHCWRDAGRPSALRLATSFLQRMETVPRTGFPRSLFNPARLEAGDAWNTLASRAVLRFELRSDDESELQRMIREAQVLATAAAAGQAGCRAALVQKGFRHATGLLPDHPLVEACRRTQGWAGLVSRLGASSSDASVCLHWGVPAITLGVAEAVGLGTSQETLDATRLAPGLRQLLACTIQAAGGP